MTQKHHDKKHEKHERSKDDETPVSPPADELPPARGEVFPRSKADRGTSPEDINIGGEPVEPPEDAAARKDQFEREASGFLNRAASISIDKASGWISAGIALFQVIAQFIGGMRPPAPTPAPEPTPTPTPTPTPVPTPVPSNPFLTQLMALIQSLMKLFPTTTPGADNPPPINVNMPRGAIREHHLSGIDANAIHASFGDDDLNREAAAAGVELRSLPAGVLFSLIATAIFRGIPALQALLKVIKSNQTRGAAF